MLRETEILRGPRLIDRTAARQDSVPSGWREYGAADAASFLPLVNHERDQRNVGYCAYDWNLTDSPECEILLGGYNAKMPDAAAIWRQGNVLSFAFDIEPADLNENGRNLLVNSIAYIARFTEDRPITIRPQDPLRLRCIWERYPNKPTNLLKLNSWMARDVLQQMDRSDVHAMMTWWRAHRSTLYPADGWKFGFLKGPDGKPLAYDQPAFFDRALERGAIPLLARFVAGGPGGRAGAADWRAWIDAHRDYLFFSDAGGYRWYVDPLAKRRKIPTHRLRGVTRATRPAWPRRRRL